MREGRGPWYLLTGFVLGAVLGLIYAWVIDPVEYVDASPTSLRDDFKNEYRALIAAAFVANGDLARAEARLALLGDGDVARALAEQAQRTLAEGQSPQEAQALGLLAGALGLGPTPVATSPRPTDTSTVSLTTAIPPSPTAVVTVTVTPVVTSTVVAETTEPTDSNPSSPTPTQTTVATRTPPPTGTPLPTRTPTATPGAPFVLRDRIFICDQNLSGPLIQVLAEDTDGRPVPGLEVVVNWEGGEDHFFTGLKPELGLGYADFALTPGVVYTLRLVDGGELISDLTPAECETVTSSRYWGSWLLVFAQP